MMRSPTTISRIDLDRNEAVVLNKETGRLILLHEQEFDLWKKLDGLYKPSSEEEDIIRKLDSAEIITDGGTAGKLFYHNSDVIIPPKFFFDLTYRCNLNCVHCHNQYTGVTEPDRGFVKQVITDLADNDVIYLDFGGGEPFLRDDILDILDYTNRFENLSFSVPTNATLLNIDLIKELKKYQNLHCISVSLDGFEKTHNKQRGSNIFNDTIKKLYLLKEYDIPTKVMTTATTINYNDIFRMGPLIKDVGAKYWKIIRYIPEFKNDNLILDKIQEQKLVDFAKSVDSKSLRVDTMAFDQGCFCMIGLMSASIYSNGDVSPCGFMPQLVSGNLHERNIKHILKEGWGFRLFRNTKQDRCLAFQVYHSDDNPKRISDEFLVYK